MGAGGYDFISARMRGKALRNDPIKGGILASSSQSALDSQAVHNPGPSWDFCPGLRLAHSPLQGETTIGLIVYFVSRKWIRRKRLCLNRNPRCYVTLPPATEAGDFALAS